MAIRHHVRSKTSKKKVNKIAGLDYALEHWVRLAGYLVRMFPKFSIFRSKLNYYFSVVNNTIRRFAVILLEFSVMDNSSPSPIVSVD